MAKEHHGDVLIEMIQVGNAVKVTAVDTVTGIEVSIVGAPSISEEVMKRNAVNKLQYVLRKGGGHGPARA